MVEPDLSGVKPLRRAETRRRLKVIREYLAQPTPTPGSRADAAKSLGMGTQQFMNLVRAWQLQKSAAAIAKAGTNAGRSRRPRARGLPPATRAAAEEALQSLPSSATHRQAIEAVRIKCEERGTRSPSDSMVSYLRLAIRRSGTAVTGTPGLIIGRAVAQLPVLHRGRMVLPELAMVARRDNGVVLLATMVVGAAAPTSFTEAAASMDVPDQGRVAVGEDDADAAVGLPRAETVTRFAAARLLAKAVGRGVGELRLSYGPLASRDPARLLRARADAALPLEEAAETIEQALADHNAARAAPPPVIIPPHPGN